MVDLPTTGKFTLDDLSDAASNVAEDVFACLSDDDAGHAAEAPASSASASHLLDVALETRYAGPRSFSHRERPIAEWRTDASI